jgi:hypothetical protein
MPVGLHGSYRFDDGSARDSSWRQNNATLTGTTSFVPGISGTGLQLDGVSGAATATFLGISMRDSFTVSAWAKLAAKDRDYTVLGQDAGRVSGFVLQYRHNADRWAFGASTQDTDDTSSTFAYAPQPAEVNRWVHLTGVYDHPAHQLRLYLDGALAAVANNATVVNAGGGLSIGRGKANGQPVGYFAGVIDEVLTDKGLVADDEIARRGGWPPPAPGQLGRFVNPSTGDRMAADTGAAVPAGYRYDGPLGMPVPAGPDTRMLYACHVWADRYLSVDANCDGWAKDGEAGLVYTTPPVNLPTVAIYKCWDGASDSFGSRDPGCDGAGNFGVLGYSLAYAPLPRYHSHSAADHLSTTYGTPPGYRNEGGGWLLSMVPQPGTQPLMSCLDGTDYFVSLNTGCDGKQVVATLGEIWTAPPAGMPSAPIFQCYFPGKPTTTRFVSYQASCEGLVVERQLGYLLTALPS